MATFAELRIDPALEEGVWADWEHGVRLRIARWGNRAFAEKLERLRAPYVDPMGRIEDGDLARDLLRKAMAGTVLTEWSGIDQPFSEDLAEQVLTDVGLEDMAVFVFDYSRKRGNYVHKAAKDIGGNSEQS